MHCRECGAAVELLTNEHLRACSGLTVQEYALRHHLPLDLLLSPDQLNASPHPERLPPSQRYPRPRAWAVLEGLRLAGLVQEQNGMVVVPGEVRRLDLLFWDLQHLRDFGFRFQQDYRFDQETHRVVARNRLVASPESLRQARPPVLAGAPPPEADEILAVYVAHAVWSQAGYLFLGFAASGDADAVGAQLQRHGVAMERLDVAEPGIDALWRTRTPDDSRRLLEALEPRLVDMPGAWERFHADTPIATVAKELPFDSAHFITDHPAKCSNLHGGRYVLHVKVRDRVDPITGCVLDYGYLKRVVTRRVIERFDHHTLNYVGPELAWRSSTEMLCVYIWEQLIDCLPAMHELELYETPQSWCCYRGPSLAELQAQGGSALLRFFQSAELGRSEVRQEFPERRRLSVAARRR